MRVFVALELPEAFADEVAALSRRLSAVRAYKRKWESGL